MKRKRFHKSRHYLCEKRVSRPRKRFCARMLGELKYWIGNPQWNAVANCHDHQQYKLIDVPFPSCLMELRIGSAGSNRLNNEDIH